MDKTASQAMRGLLMSGLLLLGLSAGAQAQDAAPRGDQPPAEQPAGEAPKEGAGKAEAPKAEEAPQGDAPAQPGQPEQAAEQGCRDQVLALADRASLGLRTLLGRLDKEQQTAALAWANCDAKDLGLVTVHESAVREFGGKNADSQRLYISPSQAVTVQDPQGAFARRELVDLVSKVPQARPVTTRVLAGAEGKQTWSGALADLNARTHALEAELGLHELGLRSGPVDGLELASSLLLAGAYVQQAKDKHPLVFGRLASSAESVDAFGLLWRRAEETLAHAQKKGLSQPTAEVIQAAHAYQPVLGELFAQAGVRAPDMNKALEAAPAAQVATKEPAKQPEPPKAEPPKAEPPKAEPPKAEPPKVVKVDQPKEMPKDAVKVPSVPLEQEDELAFQVRMGLLGAGVLLPWLWLGALWMVKRRKQHTFERLANRSLAVSTLILMMTCLVLVFLAVIGSLSSLATWDSLGLLFPLYLFVVLLIMLARLDQEERLASRHLIRKWARWGGLTLGVVAVGNVVVLIVATWLVQYVMPPSFALVGLLASVFLVKLWRTGSVTSDEAPQEGEPKALPEGEAPQEKPAPQKPEAQKPAAQPPVEEPAAATPTPGPKPAPAPAAAPSSVPDDFGDFEDEGASDAGEEISDEDFARELEALESALGGGGDKPKESGEVPDDRAELYKLLGGD